MATETVGPLISAGPVRGGVAGELKSILPGETVVLTSGLTVTIRPWGVRALTTQVPVLLGRLFAKLRPLADVGQITDPAWLMKELPQRFPDAAQEFIPLVRFTTKLPDECFEEDPPPDGRGLWGEDLLMLIEGIFTANRSFFVRLTSLRTRIREELSGPPSPPRSSGTVSGSET